jgi:predicted DNA-binding WGR domain protein
MAKNLSKFALASGQEVIFKDERTGYDHHKNFVHLEYIGYNADNKSKESDKFWQGWTEDGTFMFRFGARGTKGTVKSKILFDYKAAVRVLNEKVREKRRDGYKTAGA